MQISSSVSPVSLINVRSFSKIQPASNHPSHTTRHQYLPKYKSVDKALALLHSHGIIDATGEVDRYLASLAEMPLTDEERARLSICTGKLLKILDSEPELRITTDAQDILNELVNNNTFFEEIEIVGSAVFQILGVSFFQRFAKELITNSLPQQDETVIQELVDQLFSKEFIDYLNIRLSQPLADVDYRLIIKRPNPHAELRCLHQSVDKLISLIVSKLPKLSAEKDKEQRRNMLDKMKSLQPLMDWNWLTVENPEFYYHIIKNLAFNKFSLCSKEGAHFGIVSVGNPSESVVDLVFALQLEREEMFPSLKLPCMSWLSKKGEEKNLYPTGPRWVQALLDKVFGCVRPDVRHATEDDLKMLYCRKTKGEVNPVEHSERRLLEIARKESRNYRNKTVRKVLKQRPEMKADLEKIFPYFIAQLLKDAADVHFGKDPLAAIALTINAAEGLITHTAFEECVIIFKEMQSYWELLRTTRRESNILDLIAELFTFPYLVLSEKRLNHELPLVKLCAFMRCQAPFQPSEVNVYPRKNESIPCLEIEVKCPQRSYSLILNAPSPKQLLINTLKFFNSARSKNVRQLIEKITEAFIPPGQFEGPWSSPMLDDLRFFEHDLAFFEKAATSELFRHQALFSMFLLFSTQAQLGNHIPLDTLLVHLPTIVHQLPKFHTFIFTHLEQLISSGENQAISQFRKIPHTSKEFSELALTEKWLSILGQHANCRQLAFRCFFETIHQSIGIDSETKRKIIFNLYHQVNKGDPAYTLKLLHFMQEKGYASALKSVQLLKEMDPGYIHSTPESLPYLDKTISLLFKQLKAEQPDVLKQLLILFEGCLPLCKPLIQKLEKPVFISEKGLSPTETQQLLLKEIEREIELDYESAGELLLKNARLFSNDQLALLVRPLVLTGLKKKDVEFSHTLLVSNEIKKKLLITEDDYFSIVVEFLEKSEHPHLNLNLLQILLGCYTNRQSPRLNPSVLKRFVDQLLCVQKDPYHLLNPIPESFNRLFDQALNMLFFSLQASGQHQLCVKLFHSLHQRNGTFDIVSGLVQFVSESLNHVVNSSQLTGEVIDIARQILPLITQHDSSNELKKTMIRLVEIAPAEHKLTFLKFIADVYPLTGTEDLNYLFPVFKSFIKKGNHESALEVLKLFTGRIEAEKYTHSVTFITVIEKLIQDDKWLLSCHFLANSPFTWKKNSPINTYAEQILNTGIKNSKTFNLEDLKAIFAIMDHYTISDSQLIASFYPLCDETIDITLANKIWSVFTRYFLLSNHDKLPKLNEVVTTLLGCLKVRSTKDALDTLSNPVFFHFCATHLTKELRGLVFRTTLKTLFHMIKKTKGTERQNHFSVLENQFTLISEQLKIEQDVISDAHLDLIEFYLNLNDSRLVSTIIDHLTLVRKTELNRDRYLKSMQAVLERLSKSETLCIAHDKLIAVMTELAPSGLPPLCQARYLSLCQSPEVVDIGLKVVENCAIPMKLTLQELLALKNLKCVPFLCYVINRANKPEAMSRCEELLKNPQLRLFISKEEHGLLETEYAEHLFKQDSPENTRKAMKFIISKINDITKIDRKELLDTFVQNLIRLYFVDGQEQLLFDLAQTSIDLHSVLKLITRIRLKSLEEFFLSADEHKLLAFVTTMNHLLVTAHTKRTDVNKNEMTTIKEWVSLITGTERQALTQEGSKLVQRLEPLWHEYPVDLFELKLRLSARLSDPVDLPYIANNMSLFCDTVDRYQRISSTLINYVNGKIFVNQFAYFLKIALHYELKKKERELANLIINYFRVLQFCSDEEQISLMEQGTTLWISASEQEPELINECLSDYDPLINDILMESFELRVFGFLQRIKEGKSPISHDEFRIQILCALGALIRSMNNKLTIEIDGDRVTETLEDMHNLSDLFTEFMNEASGLEESVANQIEAVTIKGEFLKHLFAWHKKSGRTIDYYQDLLQQMELMVYQIKPETKEDRTTLNIMKNKALVLLKKKLHNMMHKRW